MPFGLTNAPATFQQWINNILRKYIDVTCIVYLDDILIFSENSEEHTKHVREILLALQEAGAYGKGEKSEFNVTSTKFLGFIVSDQGITMDTEKTSAVTDWPTPANVKDVQSFLGFANFYRRFI